MKPLPTSAVLHDMKYEQRTQQTEQNYSIPIAVLISFRSEGYLRLSGGVSLSSSRERGVLTRVNFVVVTTSSRAATNSCLKNDWGEQIHQNQVLQLCHTLVLW